MRPHPFLLPLLLLACDDASSDGPSEVCDDLCTVLVSECAYGAYPRYESCLQGCAWYEEEGADVAAELTCVEAAECDTFAIIECEHLFGLPE